MVYGAGAGLVGAIGEVNSGSAMKIGVVGAGLMGAEIALAFASSGFDVVLNDVDEAALRRARDRLAALRVVRHSSAHTISRPCRACSWWR